MKAYKVEFTAAGEFPSIKYRNVYAEDITEAIVKTNNYNRQIGRGSRQITAVYERVWGLRAPVDSKEGEQ